MFKVALVYFFIGVTGLFLFSRFFLPDGYTLAGHDSGLPIDAKMFFESRFFAWDDRLGFGVDNSYLFGSLTLHFIDYVSSLVGGTVYAGNWFNLFFWISAIFTAGLIFAYSLKDIFGKYFIFIFPPLLIFNFYLFQSIFILERAKYSVLVGIMLFLTIFLNLKYGKIPILLASLLSSLTFFIFNGGSLLGLPLFGSFFVIILGILLFDLLHILSSRNFFELYKDLRFLGLSLIFIILLNSYQIFPYVTNIINKEFFSHTGVTDISQNSGWLNYISQNTSLLNLFRMQGVPNWFLDVFKVHPDHPYSYIYLKNPIFIIVSFILPIIVFLPLILYKEIRQKKILLFFALITLIAMLFAAGTHTPFGFLYNILFENVPGFFIFRTPYYKFVGAFYIGAVVLLTASFSLVINNLINRLNKNKFNKNFKTALGFLFCFLIIGLWLSYHYNLLIPQKVFTWKTGYSTKFNIPTYIWEFKEWDNSRNDNQRILLLPPLKDNKYSDSYTFGYWSLSPITYSLSSGTVVIDDLGLSGGEKAWVNSLYLAIQQKDMEKIKIILNKLNIGYIIIRKDFEDSVVAGNFLNLLNSMDIFNKIRQFGEWELYKTNNEENTKVNTLSSFYLIPRTNENLGKDFDINEDYSFDEFDYSKVDIEQFISKKIQVYSCQSCFLENLNTGDYLPPVSVFPNSPLYFIKDIREQEKLKYAKNDSDKIDSYLGFIYRRLSEIRSMVLLGVESRYILANAQKINIYLDEVKIILENNPELSGSYKQTQQVLNLLNPMLNSIRKLINTPEFSFKPRDARSEIYDIIWRLNNIKTYFDQSLMDFSLLRNTKKYLVGNERELLINSEHFTKDINGQLILPSEILYKIETNERKINLEKNNNLWLKIKIPDDLKTNGEITMKYNLVNLFKLEKRSQELTPVGLQACISGTIISFEKGQAYEINIQAKNKIQKLKLFFQGKDKEKFIDSERGVDVVPIELSTPFRYVYQTYPDDNISLLYLCSSDRDYPDIDQISIYKLFSPVLISVTDQKEILSTHPKINFQKINPSKYSVTVDDSKMPFILTFNERFSPFWKIYQLKDNSSLEKNKEINHFMINGYANAWILDSKGNSKWILEYSPQSLFYVGLLFTGVSLITIFIVSVLIIVKKRIKYEG